jgi:hypothetical protein
LLLGLHKWYTGGYGVGLGKGGYRSLGGGRHVVVRGRKCGEREAIGIPLEVRECPRWCYCCGGAETRVGGRALPTRDDGLTVQYDQVDVVSGGGFAGRGGGPALQSILLVPQPTPCRVGRSQICMASPNNSSCQYPLPANSVGVS